MSQDVPRRSIGGGRGGERSGRGVVRQFDEQYFEAGPNGSPGNETIEVYLEGVRRPFAVMAHAGQGWVTSYRVDALGNVIHDGMDQPKHVVEHGKVELRRCNG